MNSRKKKNEAFNVGLLLIAVIMYDFFACNRGSMKGWKNPFPRHKFSVWKNSSSKTEWERKKIQVTWHGRVFYLICAGVYGFWIIYHADADRFARFSATPARWILLNWLQAIVRATWKRGLLTDPEYSSVFYILVRFKATQALALKYGFLRLLY